MSLGKARLRLFTLGQIARQIGLSFKEVKGKLLHNSSLKAWQFTNNKTGSCGNLWLPTSWILKWNINNRNSSFFFVIRPWAIWIYPSRISYPVEKFKSCFALFIHSIFNTLYLYWESQQSDHCQLLRKILSTLLFLTQTNMAKRLTDTRRTPDK